MVRPTVSIALATYNGAEYLADQLNSYLGQTLLPDELVICDDASDDITVQILEDFAASCPFEVRVIRNPIRLGYTQNFSKALSLCRSDLVFLSDQDDEWHSDKISAVLDILVDNPSCWLVIHDGEIVGVDGSRSGVTKMGQVRSGYGSDASLVTGALSVARKDFLSLALPIPEEVVGHDIWLHRLCGFFPHRRVVVPESLQTIRRHDRNSSEWVVNSTERVGRLDVLLSQASTIPSTDYGDRIRLNRALHDRMVTVGHQDRRADRASVDEAVQKLERERQALEMRQTLVDSGPVARRLLALKMLFQGRYGQFNGWRSLVRDMLR